jgi:Zn-dependent protease with chaperone function
MRRIRGSVSVGLAVLFVHAAPVRAQEASTPPSPPAPSGDALDAEIRADVERASAEAAALFDQANQARDGKDFERALELYRKASELAPSLDHPVRRACGVLGMLERHDEAIAECERAQRLVPDSPLNDSAMVQALGGRGGPGDAERALALGRRAANARPDRFSLHAWCQAALMAQQPAELRACADKLRALEPDAAETHVTLTLAALMNGEVQLARYHLARGRAAGMPEEQFKSLAALVDRVAADVEAARESGGLSGPSAGFVVGALIFIGAWVAVMLALLAAGWILSRLTLRSAERVATSGEAGGDGTDQERGLRRFYRAVVTMSGIYFYLSVPILLVSIVAAGGGAIWMFLAAGYIPIKLVLFIGIAVFVTLGAILRGLFIRGGQVELGHKIDLDANPRFRDLLESVARTIGTRPVDSAYLTPHTDMAVTERGGLWKSVRGTAGERCLIVGVGLLDGMKQVELRSVLGHEYGHFRNEDTAGGGFALAVRRSLITMIVRLAESGAATWYNPVWLFLRAYHRVYLVVSQGASRLQEVLADRWAIRAYGSEAFIRGYTHVVERSVHFEQHVQRALRDVIEHERPLPNLYTHEPAADGTAAAAKDAAGSDHAEQVREQMEREPTAYDSHPAPRQRLAWAAAMAVVREAEPDDDLPVWELFEDRDALERRMTAEVREAVAVNHGVAIAG